MSLPGATDETCRECPWRKKSAAGWLGPLSAEEWATLASSDLPIACHLAISGEGGWGGQARQCLGAAQYRANMAKLPRDPQVARAERSALVFSSPAEFISYHTSSAKKGPADGVPTKHKV